MDTDNLNIPDGPDEPRLEYAIIGTTEQLAAANKRIAELEKRLGEAEGLLREVGSGYCSDCELKNGRCIHQRAQTFLTPDTPATEPKCIYCGSKKHFYRCKAEVDYLAELERSLEIQKSPPREPDHQAEKAIKP